MVRSDLSPGMQLAQAAHAAFSFACGFPEATRRWHADSNFVVVLAVHNSAELVERYCRLELVAERLLVREPDLDDEATAFAALGFEAGRVLSSLPLAGKEVALT